MWHRLAGKAEQTLVCSLMYLPCVSPGIWTGVSDFVACPLQAAQEGGGELEKFLQRLPRWIWTWAQDLCGGMEEAGLLQLGDKEAKGAPGSTLLPGEGPLQR